MKLTPEERAMLAGERGCGADRMAFEIVTEAARMLGARELVPIVSAHIDGCLYHGSSGTLFCERLVSDGGRVRVPSSTNVGALNLLKPGQSRLSGEARKMAYRLMVAHERMGCRPSWTCAPYQADARPALGDQIAWGESNAVAFANSVLGARTNRYGDFLDIACAITGRAPCYGLHLDKNRRARLIVDVASLPEAWHQSETLFPVLGALVGRLAGSEVCAITGVAGPVPEDALKALCAAAAATGSVGLVHVVGVTPEAPDLDAATGGVEPAERVVVSSAMMRAVRRDLSHAEGDALDSVALGSPHFSPGECRQVLALAEGRRFVVPVYICTGRHTMQDLARNGADRELRALGAVFVVDTCVVVTPILPEAPGVMMTNSAKFAHYARGNTGHLPVFASLAECVASAQAGRILSDPDAWA